MSNQAYSQMEHIYVINPQASLIALNDAFNERFEKLAALAQVALSDDFSHYAKETIYHYLSTITDFVEELRELQAEIIKKNESGVLKKLMR